VTSPVGNKKITERRVAAERVDCVADPAVTVRYKVPASRTEQGRRETDDGRPTTMAEAFTSIVGAVFEPLSDTKRQGSKNDSVKRGGNRDKPASRGGTTAAASNGGNGTGGRLGP